MFGCTLLVSALDYVIDNGQLEYDWGDSPRQKPDAPFDLGWCLGMTQRTTVMGRIVG
jgi:hypothetical protein